MSAIGAQLARWEAVEGVYSRPHAQFGIGDCYMHDDGSWWVYCEANGAITGDGYAVEVDSSYQATQLTTAASSFGNRIGVCHSDQAVTDGQRGWVQIYGQSTIRTSAAAAANTQLLATATSGEVDDAGGGRQIRGLILGTAAAGAELATDAFLNYPELTTT